MRDLVKIFKALSDTNRIRIMKMLEIRTLCVCEIREVLELATSTVSKHLSLLRDAGFIIDIKDGKWVEYKIHKTGTNRYIKKLLHHLNSWLLEDEIVLKDRKKVGKINRDKICRS